MSSTPSDPSTTEIVTNPNASATTTTPRRLGIWQSIRASLSGELHDFTTGSLHRAIFLLAVPMMLEMAMESVFAVVDIYFVAKLGADAVSAVGLTESVLTLLYALAIGLSMSTTATVARRIGEGNPTAASHAAAHAIYLGLGLSLLIAIPGSLFAPEILTAMGGEPSVVEAGTGYTRLLLGSNAVIFLLFLINAAFRGAGDPTLALRSLVLANTINIVLDPCLIHGYGPFPAMGVTGAAVATTIGRGTGVLYQTWMLTRRRDSTTGGRLRITRRELVIAPREILRLIRVSTGGIAQMLIATASWVALMRIVATFGKVPVAGYTIGVRVLIFSYLPMFGLSNAAATLVGQCLGHRNPERAERAVWLTGYYTMAYAAVVTVTFVSMPDTLIGLFTSETAVAETGVEALRVISYGYVFYAWGLVMMQAFNGAGDTMTPTRINFVCFWLVQIPLAWMLAHPVGRGPNGVFWALMWSETLLTMVSVAVFRRGRWKSREV